MMRARGSKVQPRVAFVGLLIVVCDAYVLPSGPAPALYLWSSGRRNMAPPMLTMSTGTQQAVSRRAAVFLSLLPAFASVAQAKGDAALPFRTEIAGSDGMHACVPMQSSCSHAHACGLNRLRSSLPAGFRPRVHLMSSRRARGVTGNGVDLSFAYPTSWKLEEKPGNMRSSLFFWCRASF